MNKDILQKLKTLKPILKERYGIEELALFGSQARGDYTPQSDVDIVILKMKDKRFDTFMELTDYLRKQLKMPIDLGFFDSMKSYIKQKIKQDMIYV